MYSRMSGGIYVAELILPHLAIWVFPKILYIQFKDSDSVRRYLVCSLYILKVKILFCLTKLFLIGIFVYVIWKIKSWQIWNSANLWFYILLKWKKRERIDLDYFLCISLTWAMTNLDHPLELIEILRRKVSNFKQWLYVYIFCISSIDMISVMHKNHLFTLYNI